MHIPTLIHQFGASFGIALRNLAGIDHGTSLHRPQPGGNCLNWVLGHVLSSRGALIETLGGEAPMSAASSKPYLRGCEPLRDEDALEFAHLLELFEASQEELIRLLAELPAERLDEKAPFSPGGREDETIGSLLSLFAFHETYHVGQTGILRRLAGLEGAIG